MAPTFFIRVLLLLLLAVVCTVHAQCCKDCYTSLASKFQAYWNKAYVDFFLTPTLDSYNDWKKVESHCNSVLTCDIMGKSCPAGEYLVECSNLAWTMISRCQPCPDQTFRNDLLRQSNCEACRVCTSSEVETAACSSVTNRQCGCRANQYRPTPTTCADCTVCLAPTQFRTSACSSDKDTGCSPCPTGYRSISNNQGSCDVCADGYYPGASQCTLCTINSGLCNTPSTYILCQGGTKSCPICNGHAQGASCAAGQEVTTYCNGNTLNNPPCQNCGVGTERPDGTDLINGYQQCVKCGAGKYKSTPGTANCGLCTNKPANSVYRNWDVGQAASTSSCPW